MAQVRDRRHRRRVRLGARCGKEKIVEPLRKLQALGFKILATGGTQRYLTAHGLKAEKVNKVSEGRPHAADAVRNGAVQLMFNTTEGATSLSEFQASAPRRPLAKDALLHHNFRRPSRRPTGSDAVASGELEVRALQDYLA